MTITWITRERLEAWAAAVCAKYSRADIDLFIVRLRHVGRPQSNVLPNVQTARGILQ